MDKDFGKMTRKELYDIVKAKGYKGTSHYKKAQLIELLSAKKPAVKAKKGKKKPVLAHLAGASEMSSQDRITEAGDTKEVPVISEPEGIYVDWGPSLPDNYRTDRISAAAKDPNWLFVNWDLTGPRRNEVIQSLGKEVFDNAVWHLRLVDIASGSKVDLPINVESRNWYVPVSPDGIFKVKIGLMTGDGNFIEFAETREVRTPRSGPSDKVSEEWAVADEQFQKFLQQVRKTGTGGFSSSGMLK